jgi:very-short-patch-repair endonuclease
MRGCSPEYGKHRTRTAATRNFVRQLLNKSTDAEKRLWRLLRDHRFNEFKFRRQYACPMNDPGERQAARVSFLSRI